MREHFDLGLILALGLIAAMLVPFVWALWPRRQDRGLGVHVTRDGSTHIIPGRGHAVAEDCHCHPRVDGLPPELLVEHREVARR